MNASEFFSDKWVQALAEASARGDAKAMYDAIQRGANVNAAGRDGVTPLLFVFVQSKAGPSKDALRWLMKAGADPNRPPTAGPTPLQLAAMAKDPDYLRLLLDGGANPNGRDNDGAPVTFAAARAQRWPNVQCLLDRGADINATDRAGYTLLLQLAAARLWEQAAWLMQRGADHRRAAANGATVANTLQRALAVPNLPPAPWAWRVRQALVDRGVTLPAAAPRQSRVAG